MLYIKFGRICCVDTSNVEDWFDDEILSNKHLVDNVFARKVIKDIDGSKVINNRIIETKEHGMVSSMMLSRSAKAILIMRGCRDVVVDASLCNDECGKWIQQLGRKMNLLITLNRCIRFEEPFEAVCINNGKELHNIKDYEDAYFEWFEQIKKEAQAKLAKE